MDYRTCLLLSITLVACATAEQDDGYVSYEDDEKADSAYESNLVGVRNEWGEIIRPDETITFTAMARQINDLQRILAAGGQVQRGFHAKVHGCMRGELRLNASRPADVRHGVFAGPDNAVIPAWVRLSNGQGKSQQDNERDVRGLAIKLMGIAGERLLGDTAQTQDILMTTRPASHVNDALEFMEFAQAAATGKLAAWAIKHPVAAARLFRQTSAVTTLVTRYWTGSPYRFGPKIAKLGVWPCAGQAAGTQGTTTSDPDYLRFDLEHRLSSGEVCYELGVQIRKYPDNESVEKGSSVWDEQRNPMVPVARLVIPRRTTTEARADEQYCNDLAFNPWNGIVEHRPLGHMNRARWPVYKASAELRGHVAEPRQP